MMHGQKNFKSFYKITQYSRRNKQCKDEWDLIIYMVYLSFGYLTLKAIWNNQKMA